MQIQTAQPNGTGTHAGAIGGPAAQAAALEQQRAAIAQAERLLREQRTELVRMMGELRQVQEAVRSKQNPELEALRAESEQLRQLLAEHDSESEALSQTLAEREQELEALRQAPPPLNAELQETLAKLQQENERLRKLTQEKDALLEEIQKRPPPVDKPKLGMSDLESYETELHQLRRQLDEERAKVAQEIQMLRTRNQELDEATREMEMEMSRERAELARERTRLDRLRDEVRTEVERFSRDSTVFDRLAPVQRLREQIALERKPVPTP